MKKIKMRTLAASATGTLAAGEVYDEATVGRKLCAQLLKTGQAEEVRETANEIKTRADRKRKPAKPETKHDTDDPQE